jgi:hypothetical protein
MHASHCFVAVARSSALYNSTVLIALSPIHQDLPSPQALFASSGERLSPLCHEAIVEQHNKSRQTLKDTIKDLCSRANHTKGLPCRYTLIPSRVGLVPLLERVRRTCRCGPSCHHRLHHLPAPPNTAPYQARVSSSLQPEDMCSPSHRLSRFYHLQPGD